MPQIALGGCGFSLLGDGPGGLDHLQSGCRVYSDFSSDLQGRVSFINEIYHSKMVLGHEQPACVCVFELKMSSLLEISNKKVLRVYKILWNERQNMCKIKRFLTNTVIPMQNLEMKLSLCISYKK